MKKILALLLLLLVLPMQAMASDVQSMVDALPAVEDLREMDMEQQREIYDQTQAAYDAYMALSDAEKMELKDAEDVFETLFGYFNTLVAPAEEAEESAASNIISTAIAALIGLLLARKLITKKRI